MNADRISTVIAAQKDQRDVGLGAAKSLGYFGLGHRAAQSPDFDDFLCGQELLETQTEVPVDSVLLVHPIIDPLKVGGGAIRLHPVNVIDHRKIGQVGDEGGGDEPMDVDRLSLSVSVQNDLSVTNSVDTSSNDVTENSSCAASRMIVDAKAINASHVSEITDFVAVKLGDSSPFFVNHLSTPAARSVHSTVASDATQGA